MHCSSIVKFSELGYDKVVRNSLQKLLMSSDIFDKLDSMISSLVDVLEKVVPVEGDAAVRTLV